LNIILAEDRNYPIGSFIDLVRKEFPHSSCITLTDNNYLDMRKSIKTPPLLTKGWFVLVFVNKLTTDILQYVNVEDNVTIFVVRSNEELAEVERLFAIADIRPKIVNNLKPEQSKVLKYIRQELGVDLGLAKYIAKRHRYYLPKVFESVEVLKVVPKITRDSVKRYTRASSDMTFPGLFDFIIGVGKFDYNRASTLVSSYRYGGDFLFKYTLKRFKLYLMLYDKILEGSLSIDNYKAWYEANKKELKDISEHLVKKVLEAFGEVSYDKLWYLSNLYQSEYDKGASVGSFLAILSISEY